MSQKYFSPAIIHLNVLHSKPAENREALISLVEKASKEGADLAAAPELCLSGYGFEDRQAILPLAETYDGPTAQALTKLSRSEGLYIVIGLAERDKKTNILYNSAFVFHPQGHIVCRYRKINAESRWASPGLPSQGNVFQTPWGLAGVLVCADSYHSLIPRAAALNRLGLLIVVANWPPTGKFPENVFRLRAKENHLYLLVANRGGKEERLDCSEAKSYLIDPNGQVLLGESSDSSKLFMCPKIPLLDDGTFPNNLGQEQLFKTRRPERYHRIYSSLQFFNDLTSSFKLPEPREVKLLLIASGQGHSPVKFLLENQSRLSADSLVILPLWNYDLSDKKNLTKIANQSKVKILTANKKNQGQFFWAFEPKFKAIPIDSIPALPLMTLGPLVVGPTTIKDMIHPEAAITAAKLGADLFLAIEENFDPSDKLMVFTRAIEQSECAVVAQNAVAFGARSSDHGPGRSVMGQAQDIIEVELDLKIIRNKRFQDRIDFETILANDHKLI
ncbi:MAG: hypothetical protein LBV23_08940 [Deltaproteobacteria bacterium]|jgi:predicted amidohydrolase|nr:hypothetical protein [Deltaproteobacteria bacterium]